MTITITKQIICNRCRLHEPAPGLNWVPIVLQVLGRPKHAHLCPACFSGLLDFMLDGRRVPADEVSS